MSKRGYKLQEFVAHSTNVNCLNIGKKACKLLLTGGDDHKVNLWAIGKSTSLMSLCGHTSPVESVAFDSAEVLVVAGASSGMIKLWDLEEAKMIRSLTGHKLNCTAVAFHPFGEFFASGSMDYNLRIWDIRKKECIHTYKGHTRGISTIRFSPDGRWVVSGGLDNVVKIWDLTAGKLLHDFKFHEGHIRSIDFHPLEFLLATGSADKTVKFWDLETFELIGSARPEATGVRSITFHPDGRTLFCGLEDSLKVYSWEPLIRHDAVDMGWSTLGDLCIHEGKVLGCSYYQNSVGVWVADISNIEPYGAGFTPKQNNGMEQIFNLQGSHSAEKVASTINGSCSISSDYEAKEIKNIYVDSTGGKPVASQAVRSLCSPKVVVPSDSKETSDLSSQKKSPAVSRPRKSNGQAFSKSFVVPSVVPRDIPAGKYSANLRRETISSTKPSSDSLIKPVHTQRPLHNKVDVGRPSVTGDSWTLSTLKSDLDNSVNLNIKTRLLAQGDARECSEENHPNSNSAAEKIEDFVSPAQTPSTQENSEGSLNCSKGSAPVRIVNGVVVVRGRTRSLVERFERREGIDGDDHATFLSPQVIPVTDKTCIALKAEPQISGRESASTNDETFLSPQVIPVTDKTCITLKAETQISGRESASSNDEKITEDLMQNHDVFLSTLRSRLTKLQVVRHFWEQNNIKGAINALRKLPDHSVQADIVSVLIEKTEIFNLDLFSCLLPVLMGLLDSKIERHANVTLEMLLKLAVVFGPVIRSTVTAFPGVGVDLRAEQRLECCKRCFIQLGKIQKILPEFARRGGALAKCALQLNLVLQES